MYLACVNDYEDACDRCEVEVYDSDGLEYLGRTRAARPRVDVPPSLILRNAAGTFWFLHSIEIWYCAFHAWKLLSKARGLLGHASSCCNERQSGKSRALYVGWYKPRV